jgi:hypothetical protein
MLRGVGSSKCGSGPPAPHHLTIPPLRECVNPQAAASKPSHSTRKPHHQTHRSPNTTSQLLVASPHHAPNQSCSEPPGGARAGANSGAANGSFIARSTRSIESGSWIAASSRRAPPQRGHVNTSTPNARVLSANCAEHALHRIGQFRFVDDQRAVGGFGRVRRPVAQFDVGNQLVNEDQSRQADRR